MPQPAGLPVTDAAILAKITVSTSEPTQRWSASLRTHCSTFHVIVMDTDKLLRQRDSEFVKEVLRDGRVLRGTAIQKLVA